MTENILQTSPLKLGYNGTTIVKDFQVGIPPNRIVGLVGPNGSGKTTFATEFLPEYAQCPRFINADLIATGLSPFSPEQAALKAGKLVIRQIKEFSDSQGNQIGNFIKRDKK